MGLFDRVGLRKNVRKTVGMVCQPCRAAGVRDKAYTRRMTREGRIFKESHPEHMLCPECRKDLEKGSLVAYRQNQHNVAKGGQGSRATRKLGAMTPGLSERQFPLIQDQGPAQSKVVVSERIHG